MRSSSAALAASALHDDPPSEERRDLPRALDVVAVEDDLVHREDGHCLRSCCRCGRDGDMVDSIHEDEQSPMTAIRKSVTIPENHRLHMELDVPKEVPAGEAEVVVYLRSVQGSESDGKRAVAILRRIAGRGTLREAIPDPVTWQREMRQDRVLPGRK
jgi:hypothetical protein